LRLKLNFNSIKFRVWMNFLVFAGIILVLVWFLQVFFLNNYYEEMKIRQSKETAVNIASNYRNGQLGPVISQSKKASNGDDIYIRIDQDGRVIFPDDGSLTYQAEINSLEPLVDRNMSSEDAAENEASKTLTDPESGEKSFSYAIILDKDNHIVLYLVSPLRPVTSTIEVLQNQLMIIIIIALMLAFILSFWLSTRITKPITKITKQARKLADGQYGITFPTSGQYSEINNLSETLNKASTELEKTVTLQKDLMANVSHDLRTPLTMIKSYAEMIRDLSGDIPEKREKHLNVIIEETDRLNTLVGDMLTLSRMQAGTMKLEISDFDIKEAIQSILEPYKILEEQQGFHIIFSCREDKIMVRGDEDRIKQVISNLLTNAIKYSGKDKKVYVSVRRWNRRVHIEVRDHGVGIKPEELDHIWERYYKTSSNHARTASGSGLGLSIVKEILTLHKAKYGVESKVGVGTTFWLELLTTEQPAPLPKKPGWWNFGSHRNHRRPNGHNSGSTTPSSPEQS
jgi:signal transduction histidine kinase